MKKQEIGSFIEKKRDVFIELSDKIWAFAETAFVEFQSADLLCEALEKEGFSVERGTGGVATAFCGSWGSGSGGSGSPVAPRARGEVTRMAPRRAVVGGGCEVRHTGRERPFPAR